MYAIQIVIVELVLGKYEGTLVLHRITIVNGGAGWHENLRCCRAGACRDANALAQRAAILAGLGMTLSVALSDFARRRHSCLR